MKLYVTFIIFILFLPQLAVGQQAVKNNEHLSIDYRRLISHADLIYHQPVIRSEAGMPVGNGRMGSLVWTTPSAIHFQINRKDIFGNNSASNNFYQRNTDYCGGAGFVSIDLGQAVFAGKGFYQKLSCYDGLISLKGKDISAQILAWNKRDVMAIHVQDKRSCGKRVEINLSMLREPVQQRGDHFAISHISTAGDHIILTQQFREDNYYCGSAVVIGIQGAKATAEMANETTVKLIVKPEKGPFTVYISSAAGFNPKEDLISKSTKELDTAMKEGFKKLVASNEI